MDEEIKSLVRQMNEKCKEKGLNSVVLVGDGKDLIRSLSGSARQQILMSIYHEQYLAERLGTNPEEMKYVATASLEDIEEL